MQTPLRQGRSVGPVLVIVLVFVGLASVPAAAQQGRLQLDQLGPLAARAREVVDVTLDRSMLQIAAGALAGADDDASAISRLISGVEGIYVKSFEFEDDQTYAESDVEGVRRQLTAPGWSRMVVIRDSSAGESVEIHMWQNGAQPGGVAILVAEPRELTVVNIVGNIDLSALAALQGQFGIPRLPTATEQQAPASGSDDN